MRVIACLEILFPTGRWERSAAGREGRNGYTSMDLAPHPALAAGPPSPQSPERLCCLTRPLTHALREEIRFLGRTQYAGAALARVPPLRVFSKLRKHLNTYIVVILRFSKKYIIHCLFKNLRQLRCKESNGLFTQAGWGSNSTQV